MSGLLYLIPVALFLGLLGLAAFIWSLRSGQYDDLEGAAERILYDDEDNSPPSGKWSESGRDGPGSPAPGEITRGTRGTARGRCRTGHR